MNDAPGTRPSEEIENVFREGLPPRRRIDPCTIVLFGATGDLTERKLIPALWDLTAQGHLSSRIAIVGVARRPWTDDSFREKLRSAIAEHRPGTGTEGGPLLERFLESIYYHRAPFEDASGYVALGARLDEIENALGTGKNRLYYLATAPEYFPTIVRHLGEAGLAQQGPPSGPRGKPSPWVRVVVEKPFGHDLASAQELNAQILSVLDESQVFRIDHYLGKETVQNILALRFANGIFEPLWNSKYVEHVQITVAEEIGIGDRGPYYDSAGALRDMVQNHMMQLLSLVAMEPPSAIEADAIRDEKVKVLKALRPFDRETVRSCTVRGQYTSGTRLGELLPGYREEERVPAGSTTATYAALKLHIDNWRWAGVPFFLRHGKRLPKRLTEIAIRFRTPPLRLFATAERRSRSNTLVLDIQPDEGISLCFGSKIPGPDIRIRQVKMDFRYGRSFGVASPDAYERLLLDAIAGDSTLFTRRDEVEWSWRFFDPVLRSWVEDGARGLELYPAGTWGPERAEDLFDGYEDGWRRL